MIKKLMNKDANANNTRVVHQAESGCCPDLINCEYQADITGTKSVTELVIEEDGLEVALALTTATSVSELQSSLEAALDTAGYDLTNEEVVWPAGDGVLVEADGSTWNVILFGDIRAVKIKSNGNYFAFDRDCVEGAEYTCEWTVADDTEVGDMTYGGSSETIGDASGYASGDATGLQADVETALTALGITYTDVTVTEASGVFTVTMKVVDVECSLIQVGDAYTSQDSVKPYYS